MYRSIPHGFARIALFIAAVLAGPTVAMGQDSTEAQTAERCTAAEWRQFDFWLGDWEVRNGEGDVLGSNEITRVARGCGLLENWRGIDGGRGLSLNTYEDSGRTWTQRWVGDGATLWLKGGLEANAMVLTGTDKRNSPKGAVLDRITWTPLPDGRVLQQWDISPDGGRLWLVAFKGYYQRR
jgi:hypothetical protein